AEDGIRDATVTGVQTCALPIFIDDAGKLLRRYLLADFVFRPVTQSSCFFNARSGWGTQVQRKLATIHRWKKVLSQPREQSEGERSEERRVGKERRTRWWRR